MVFDRRYPASYLIESMSRTSNLFMLSGILVNDESTLSFDGRIYNLRRKLAKDLDLPEFQN